MSDKQALSAAGGTVVLEHVSAHEFPARSHMFLHAAVQWEAAGVQLGVLQVYRVQCIRFLITCSTVH